MAVRAARRMADRVPLGGAPAPVVREKSRCSGWMHNAHVSQQGFIKGFQSTSEESNDFSPNNDVSGNETLDSTNAGRRAQICLPKHRVLLRKRGWAEFIRGAVGAPRDVICRIQ